MVQTNAQLPPSNNKKRKQPPNTTTSHPKPTNTSKKQKTAHFRDARLVRTQTSSKALQNGALDVDKFVQAREFEIRALEQSMQRSKKALNRRAFQQVPPALRRRTASHNVKRVPKRLRKRAGKEMLEDNTPTVTARRRTPTRHMRLRLETAKKLRGLGARKKQAGEGEGGKATVLEPNDNNKPTKPANPTTTTAAAAEITTRPSKPKTKTQATLASPLAPKPKFRKRQLNKSWLPTHLFHAKRAHMTPPSAPLWRFAVPLAPTQKSYRPTHRAARERGAVAWDVSYLATVALEGREGSLLTVLRGLGVDVEGVKGGEMWRRGIRVVETLGRERESGEVIAPVVVIWCGPSAEEKEDEEGKKKRKLFLRVHPSAFFQLWEEVVRLAKVAKPAVMVEDLRFEIGSIEITGPGSTEALLSALWPTNNQSTAAHSAEKTWPQLAGLTNPSSFPAGAVLAFDVQDPRLHHPPRTIALPKTQAEQDKLLQLLATWPVDQTQQPSALFSRTARLEGSKLPSQKNINRRKALAPPGSYPEARETDPDIPVLLHTFRHNANLRTQREAGMGTYTLLAPWRAIPALWYSIQYYPLSTGQQPRFAGLEEKRQLAFESAVPFFPVDFPGTQAGWAWEIQERERRLEEWGRRPKGKRVSWEKVEIGGGRKGEVGVGWACDWEVLLGEGASAAASGESAQDAAAAEEQKKPAALTHLSPAQALALFKSPPSTTASQALTGKLFNIRISLLARGVPKACARVYRLPSASTISALALRKAWLSLLPSRGTKKQKDKPQQKQRKEPDIPTHVQQRQLARSLLAPPQERGAEYPPCPGEEDLIGFVTTGEFNLAEGKGTGVGCLSFGRVLEGLSVGDGEERLCVVRNSGERKGWLGRWEVV